MADDQVKSVLDGEVIAWEDVLTRILRMADVPKRSSIFTPEWLKYDKSICTVNSIKDLESGDKEYYFFHRSTMTVTNNNQQAGNVGIPEDSHHKAWTYVRVEIPYTSNDASKQYGNWIAIEPSKTELDPAKTDEARLAFKSIGDLAEEIWVAAEKAIKDIESDKDGFKGSSAQAYAKDLNELKYSFANVAFRIIHGDARDSHGWAGSNWLETLRVLSEAQTKFLNVVSKCRENLAAAAYHDPQAVLKSLLNQVKRKVDEDWTRWSTARPEAGWTITVTLPDNPPTEITPTSVTFDMLTRSGWEVLDKFAKTIWNAAVRQACDDEIRKAVPELRLAFKTAQESLSSLTPPGFTPTTKFDNGSGVGDSDTDGKDDAEDWFKKIFGDNKDDKGGNGNTDGLPKPDDRDVGGPGSPEDANTWPSFDDQKAGDSGGPTGGGSPNFDDLPVGDSAGDINTGGTSPLGDLPVGDTAVGDYPLGDLPVGDSAGRTTDNTWDYPGSSTPPLGSWTLSNGGSGTNSSGSRSYFDSVLDDGAEAPDASLFPTAVGDSLGALGDLDLGGQGAGDPGPAGGFDPGSGESVDGPPGLGDSTGTGVPLGGTAGSPSGYGGAPMSPMSGMGGVGGTGQQEKERERTTWLAEEEDVWGTDPECAPAVLGRFDDAPSGSEQTRPAQQPSRRPQPGQSPTRQQLRGRG